MTPRIAIIGVPIVLAYKVDFSWRFRGKMKLEPTRLKGDLALAGKTQPLREALQLYRFVGHAPARGEGRSAPAQEKGPGEGQFVDRHAPKGQTQPAGPPIQNAGWLITPDKNVAQAEVDLFRHQAR
jgi:hypothetical protein